MGRITVAVSLLVVALAVDWPDSDRWRACQDTLHCVVRGYEQLAEDWNDEIRFEEAMQGVDIVMHCHAALYSDCAPLIPLVSWETEETADLVLAKLHASLIDIEEPQSAFPIHWNPKALGPAANCFQLIHQSLELTKSLSPPDTPLTPSNIQALFTSLRSVAESCHPLSS